MEIINDNPKQEPRRKKETGTSRNVYLGALLVLIGILWMLRNFGIMDNLVFSRIFSWQTLLMALGGYFLIVRRWVIGVTLLATGIMFAISEWMHLCIHLDKIILPVIVIAAGIAIAIQQR